MQSEPLDLLLHSTSVLTHLIPDSENSELTFAKDILSKAIHHAMKAEPADFGLAKDDDFEDEGTMSRYVFVMSIYQVCII